MLTAIPAFEQNAIHHGTERGDVGHNLYAVFLMHLIGKAVDALRALRNIRADAFKVLHNAKARHKTGIRWVIEFPRKNGNVRRIRADNAETEIGGIRAQPADQEKQTELEMLCHRSPHSVRLPGIISEQ